MFYKDKTFCSGGNPRCTAFKDCPRALTPEVIAGAKDWMNPHGDPDENELMELIGPPIAQFTEPNELDCYELPHGENTRKEENEN